MFTALIAYLTPPSRLAGRLSTQSLLFALGEGTFLAGSAVFFTQVVGLTAAAGRPRPDARRRRGVHRGLPDGQAGRPLRSRSACGRSAPPVRPRWCSPAGPSSTASPATSPWPWPSRSSGTLGGAGRTAPTSIDVLPAAERVESRAYMYSALNVGFTLGALIGGVALAFESLTVISALPWFTAVVFAAQRRQHHPAAPGLPRPQDDRGAQGQGRGPRPDAERRLARRVVLQRRDVDQPGHPQPRHPAVAGAEDRRPVGGCWPSSSAPTPSCASCCRWPPRAGSATSRPGCARSGSPPSSSSLSCVITLSTHHTLGPADDRPVLPGPRDPHRRRAVPLGRQLDLRGRADGPAAPRRVPGRGRAHGHPGPVSGRRRSTRSS